MKRILQKSLIVAVISVLALCAVFLCACNNATTHNEKNIVISSDVTTIKAGEYKDYKNLETIFIPDSVTNIGKDAFAGCDKLTIYTSQESPLRGWISGWNSLDRPVVLGCILSEDKQYVISFNKEHTNPYYMNAANGVNNPYREGYEFDGWYTSDDFSGTQYMDLTTAPNGILYAKWIKNN